MSDPTNVVVGNCNYWMRISVVLQICLKEALLDILHDPAIGELTRNTQQLHVILSNFKAKEENKLKRVIKPFQWDKICHFCTANCPVNCPRKGVTDSQDLDITCIVILILNLDKFLANIIKQAWKNLSPHVKEAREIRNELIHCSLQEINTQLQFDDFWDRIERNLTNLKYNNMRLFLSLKTSSLDPYLKQQMDSLEEKYEELNTTKCDKADMDAVQKEMRLLHQKQQNEVERLKERVKNLEIKDKIEDKGIAEKSQRLKQDTKKKYEKVQVAFAPQSSSHLNKQIDRDDIIVNLSLIVDADSVLAMENVPVTGIDKIHQLRQKQKDLASIEVEYKKIITSPDNYVIISGSPGCGKTTLVETLLYQWATNKLWAKEVEFDFIFIIYLRKLARFRDKDITAERILSHFYPEQDFNQGKTVLILEGFDELFEKEKLKQKEDEFSSYTQAIYDLLDPNNTRLPFTRIVTSRPGSCKLLFKTVLSQPSYTQTTRLIEITGFSSNNIYRYLLKHFPEGNTALGLMKKLRGIPLVYDMMVIPFYCWGVCYLLKNDIAVEEFGQTCTALYTNLITLYIRNHGLRNQSLKLSDVLHDVKFKEVCLGIAKLAFKLQVSDKINFTRDDLPGNMEMKDLIRNSGLLIKVESDNFGSPTYQFLHYTFQEFLVALHIFATGVELDYTVTKNKTVTKQTQYMLAGLLGGSIKSSESCQMVQEFTRLFTVSKEISIADVLMMGKVLRNGKLVLSDSFHLPIIFEYQNPILVDINLMFPLLYNIFCFRNTYIKQCRTFFQTQCKNKKLQFRKMTLDLRSDDLIKQLKDFSINEQVNLIKDLMTVSCCEEIIMDVPSNLTSLMVEEISENNLQFEKITLSAKNNEIDEGTVRIVLEHCHAFKVLIDTFDQLESILSLYKKFQETCKSNKLIIVCPAIVGAITPKELIKSMDVCKEIIIVFGFYVDIDRFRGKLFFTKLIENSHSHSHSDKCLEPSNWNLVKKTQSKFDKLLKAQRCLKVLETIKVGGDCIMDPFQMTDGIFPTN